MVHKTITSFHINLYANKSYPIDGNPLRDSIDTPKFQILETTLVHAVLKIPRTMPCTACVRTASNKVTNYTDYYSFTDPGGMEG